MLEISLSAVAAFAAYTLYSIVGDEIRANKLSKLNADKKPLITTAPNAEITKSAPKPKAVTKPKATTTRKPRSAKTEKPADQLTVTSGAILAYLSQNGAVTITNLTKQLKMDKETVTMAVERLIAEKSVLSIKRGGYPAIAPIIN